MTAAWEPANGTEFELFYAEHCRDCVFNGLDDEDAPCPCHDGNLGDEIAWIAEPRGDNGSLFEPRCLFRQERAEGEACADLSAALQRSLAYQHLERDPATGRPVIA